MRWPKKLLTINLLAALAMLCGCGVKGDPLPPERPPELGRGRPTFKRATEGIQIEKARPANHGKQDDDSEDENE